MLTNWRDSCYILKDLQSTTWMTRYILIMQYYRIHYFVDVLWLIDMVNMTPLLKDSQSTRLIYRILPVSHAYCNYSPQTKFREGNVFTPVCHSAHGGRHVSKHAMGRGCFPGDVCQRMSSQGGCLPRGSAWGLSAGGCTPPWIQRQTPLWTQRQTSPHPEAETPPGPRGKQCPTFQHFPGLRKLLHLP